MSSCVFFFCRTLCLRWRTVWGHWSKPSSLSWWMFSIGQSCSSLRTLTLAESVKAEGSYQSRFKSATISELLSNTAYWQNSHSSMTYNKWTLYTIDAMWWFMLTVIYLYHEREKENSRILQPLKFGQCPVSLKQKVKDSPPKSQTHWSLYRKFCCAW